MKKLLSLTVLLGILLSVASFAIVPATAVSHLERDKGIEMTDYYVNSKGYSSDYYESVKKLEEVPRSFEAWVYLSSSLGGAKAGTIIGSDNAKGGGRFSFSIAKNYKPSLTFKEKSGTVHSVVFSDAIIETGDWCHVVAVWDEGLNEFRCYLNGELKDTVAVSAT